MNIIRSIYYLVLRKIAYFLLKFMHRWLEGNRYRMYIVLYRDVYFIDRDKQVFTRKVSQGESSVHVGVLSDLQAGGLQDSFLERVSVSEFVEYEGVPVQFVYCELSTGGYLALDSNPKWRKELKSFLPRKVSSVQKDAVEILATNFRK